MIFSDKLEKILSELEKDNSKFKFILDKVLKFAVNLFNTVKDLQEELEDLDEIYQAYIEDADMQYWIKVSEGKMEYHQGINKEASIHAWFTRKLIIGILKGEIMGSEAYMKGLIKAEGSLSKGLRYIKLYRLFFKYIHAKFEINGFPG